MCQQRVPIARRRLDFCLSAGAKYLRSPPDLRNLQALRDVFLVDMKKSVRLGLPLQNDIHVGFRYADDQQQRFYELPDQKDPVHPPPACSLGQL